MASTALKVLARSLPRAADIAFEAHRHGAQCDVYLQRASHGIEYLHMLLSERATCRDDGRLLEVEAHLRVLEHKARLYGDIVACVGSIHDALRLAMGAFERLGRCSTNVMRMLRARSAGAETDACRAVVQRFVVDYTSCVDRYNDIELTLADMLPHDIVAIPQDRLRRNTRAAMP